MIFKKFLKKHRISYMQAALDLGVHYIYISQLANGKRFPSDETLEKILEYTKGEVSLEELRPPEKCDRMKCPCCGSLMGAKKSQEVKERLQAIEELTGKKYPVAV